MTRISLRTQALACALLAGTALAAAPAGAQTVVPVFRNLDANGVDLAQGDFLKSFAEGSIGSGEAELALLRIVGNVGTRGGSQWDNIYFSASSTDTRVFFGPRQDIFPAAAARGASLTTSDGGLTYVYVGRDGSAITFTNGGGTVAQISNLCDGSGTQSLCNLIPTSITSPDGKTVTLEYEFWENCAQQQNPDDPENCTEYWRLSKISNSYGYRIAFSYASAAGSGHVNPPATFYQRTGAAFYNDLVSTTSPQASVSYSYPSSGVTDITDTGGRTWRATSTGTLYAIRRPGASADTTSATRSSTTGLVTSVTNEGVTTNYSRSVSGTTATMTLTDPLSHVTTVVSDLNTGLPTSVTDPNSHTTSYQYDGYGRLTQITAPEGNYVTYQYDSRGNVKQTQAVPKSGSGLPLITTSATYDATCTNPVTCNQPITTTDARGNTTDYTYDSTHGGVLTVTAPAPTTGATRPQTRYSYTLANGAYRVTGVSACQTGSSCTGTADEVKATIHYDANGNIDWKSVGAGDNSLTATTTMTYDAVGNLLTVDGPLAGTADTTRYRYDGSRQLVGVVSPDPDGSGSLKNRAVKNTYTNGLLTKVERGTVNSQSDSDWAAFTPLQETDTTYDANARPVTQSLASGGTTYSLVQTSYDVMGRPECVATRMSPSYFGSLPSDACTLGTEQMSPDYGPDRIVKTTYDWVGRPTLVQTAWGVTGVQSDEVTTTYTANGKVETVTDAESNKTTYVYDGQDRLWKTLYPSATKGAGTSNSADYEQLTYETTAGGTATSGTVASLRNRANQTISYTYDALGRLTFKDLPNTLTNEKDATFTYDNLGRLKTATEGWVNQTFSYDALGRLTSRTTLGTTSYQYDLAGRRTRMTWNDGFYVDYDYLVTGETAHIRENGATSGVGVLATYAYDDLGRRTSLTRGDGTVQSWGYDGASRLTSLADLAGTTYAQTLGFTYNPAGQIVTNDRSNNLYAWQGHYNVSRTYASNGLNQYTQSGAVNPTYDAKGNLVTAGGSQTYAYSAENQLMTTGAGAYSYYSTGELLSSGAASRTFVWAGADLVTELDLAGTTVKRRYVHGPGSDEPLVWYEGSGTTDRRFLHADERGSIVAVTDSAGAVLNVNTYDEYGNPRSSNIGRFQYTGQAWLPEHGFYYYKARMYSPSFGRFMQPDPIGYGDGMNWYAYVNGDPVNSRDPSGLQDTDNGPPLVVTGSVCPPGYKCYNVGHDFQNVQPDTANSQSEGAMVYITGKRKRGSSPKLPYDTTGLLVFKDVLVFRGRCPAVSWYPQSFGYGASAHAMLGTPLASGAATASAANMHFTNDSASTIFTGGAEIQALDQSSTAPNGPRPFVLGGAAGAGVFGTISNASSRSQLSGTFHNIDLSIGIFDLQIAFSGGIWQVSLGTRSAGLAIAVYDTNTYVPYGGCATE